MISVLRKNLYKDNNNDNNNDNDEFLMDDEWLKLMPQLKATYKTIEHRVRFIQVEIADRTTEIIDIYAEERSFWNKKQW